MADQQEDYSMVYDFIYRIEKRITSLEKDASFIEGFIKRLEGKRLGQFQSLDTELSSLKSQIGLLKNNFNDCVREMISLSKNLRNSVKKEDIDAMNVHVDEIKFDEYITQKDLSRGV